MGPSVRILLILALIVGIPATDSASAGVKISHLYNLSNFSGVVPYSDVNLYADRDRDETYAVSGRSVRLFNGVGMEIYRYDHDPAFGTIMDLAVDEEGDILLLVYDRRGTRYASWSLVRCDYRGTAIERLATDELPAEFAGLGPNLMFYRDGSFLLVSRSQLKAVALDRSGQFLHGYDFAELINLENPEDNEIFGFSLDRAGNMLFTIPTQFKAYIVSPEGSVAQFGTPGSAPGKFGIVSGIVRDDNGNILIADKLRWVVMVFDSNYQLISEFGDEVGRRRLIRPTDLTIGANNRLYVTQSQQQGVAVFGITTPRSGLASRGAGDSDISRSNPGTEPASNSEGPAPSN